MNNAEPEVPDVVLILTAYAKVANRVATVTIREDAIPERATDSDVALLAALSSAVLVIGSEYRRQVLAMDVRKDQQKVHLQ